jgi:very-short-patch-repair endonuclease
MLDVLEINYLSEQPFPPYTVDVYLPEWHLGLEIDGPFHQKSRDESRDKFIEVYFGLPILRFNVANGWVTRSRLKEEVTAFIEKHEATTEERKALARSRR